jgi:hypothetical protein
VPFTRRPLAGALSLLLLPVWVTVWVIAAPPARAAIAPPPTVKPRPGYWLTAADGGIFTFAAPYDGSTGSMTLNRPVVGMAPTADAGGYWLLASDGGIFSFGDARFFGSTGGMHINQPIVGMTATPTGRGYWLVAADGGIFAFGDARFFGSTGGIHINQPIVGMAATSDGAGYWLVASDGGIFAFGDARFFGSAGGSRLNQPIVGMGATPDGAGYWLVASDGGIFAYGTAPFLGSMGAHPLNQPIVGMAIDTVGDPYQSGTTGYDISWPQCGQTYPPPPHQVAIVGANDGHPFSVNPCLAGEAAWAGPSLTIYANAGPLVPGDQRAMTGPAGSCAGSDLVCQSYNWGWNAAVYDVTTAAGAGVASATWWLDVETANGWCLGVCASNGATENDRVIQGMIDGLRAHGASPGIYSDAYQFGLIAGDTYSPDVPLWVVAADLHHSAHSAAELPQWCNQTYAFGGGQIWATQWTGPIADGRVFDQDYAC